MYDYNIVAMKPRPGEGHRGEPREEGGAEERGAYTILWYTYHVIHYVIVCFIIYVEIQYIIAYCMLYAILCHST